MNKGLWIARKNYLYTLIRRLSEARGGDGVDELREHCEEVLKAHPNEAIEDAIKYYEHMVEELQYYLPTKYEILS